MRTALCLAAVAALTTAVTPRATLADGRSVTLSLPAAVLGELETAAARTGTPVSTLLADAWEARAAAVRDDVRPAAKAKGARIARPCWFDAATWRDVQQTAAVTGLDEGTLLATAWRLNAAR